MNEEKKWQKAFEDHTGAVSDWLLELLEALGMPPETDKKDILPIIKDLAHQRQLSLQPVREALTKFSELIDECAASMRDKNIHEDSRANASVRWAAYSHALLIIKAAISKCQPSEISAAKEAVITAATEWKYRMDGRPSTDIQVDSYQLRKAIAALDALQEKQPK